MSAAIRATKDRLFSPKAHPKPRAAIAAVETTGPTTRPTL